ncbi:NHL repeat-containing protein [Pseudomonas retamae]|uniref:Delta-60 repeat domain-containing protein n=1 Tax=Pseudomonas retamae TaxID=702110 RepID=A0ABW7DB07_9PSED
MSKSISNAGTLDPAFNKGGVLYFKVPGIFGRPDALLALPDNKILIARGSISESDGFMLGRLLEDGTPDSSFGPSRNGFIKVPVKNMQVTIRSLKLLANGGWLISSDYYVDLDSHGLLIVRMLADGRLDESLNGSGLLFIDSRDLPGLSPDIQVCNTNFNNEPASIMQHKSANATGASVAEQSGGKFLIFADTRMNGKRQGMILRRNADGSSDETFGGGFVIVDLPGIKYEWNQLDGIATQVSGQILVGGTYKPENGSLDERGVFVTRFTSSGQIDMEFNRGLPVVIPNNDRIELRNITVDGKSGRILAVGVAIRERNPNGLIVVLKEDGSYDHSFNKGRPLLSKLGPLGEGWKRGILQPDGAVVVSGYTGRFTFELTAVTARFLKDGGLDGAFNSGQGFAIFDDEKGWEEIADLAQMDDGRIVVCGHFWNTKDSGMNGVDGGWVLRYLA